MGAGLNGWEHRPSWEIQRKDVDETRGRLSIRIVLKPHTYESENDICGYFDMLLLRHLHARPPTPERVLMYGQ